MDITLQQIYSKGKSSSERFDSTDFEIIKYYVDKLLNLEWSEFKEKFKTAFKRNPYQTYTALTTLSWIAIYDFDLISEGKVGKKSRSGEINLSGITYENLPKSELSEFSELFTKESFKAYKTLLKELEIRDLDMGYVITPAEFSFPKTDKKLEELITKISGCPEYLTEIIEEQYNLGGDASNNNARTLLCNLLYDGNVDLDDMLKRLKPICEFLSNKGFLILTDFLAKYHEKYKCYPNRRNLGSSWIPGLDKAEEMRKARFSWDIIESTKEVSFPKAIKTYLKKIPKLKISEKSKEELRECFEELKTPPDELIEKIKKEINIPARNVLMRQIQSIKDYQAEVKENEERKERIEGLEFLIETSLYLELGDVCRILEKKEFIETVSDFEETINGLDSYNPSNHIIIARKLLEIEELGFEKTKLIKDGEAQPELIRIINYHNALTLDEEPAPTMITISDYESLRKAANGSRILTKDELKKLLIYDEMIDDLWTAMKQSSHKIIPSYELIEQLCSHWSRSSKTKEELMEELPILEERQYVDPGSLLRLEWIKLVTRNI